MDFAYRFPVVRGRQAKREYYIAMVPLKMLARLFPSDDEYISPEYRAQRRINETRIPAIRDYILDNRDTYVFSALSASIDGEYNFVGSPENQNIGILEVSLDAKFLINDGQHRKAAILAAISEDESLNDETISIVFFEDCGLQRSQQMFTDLNKHAVKTSNSIAELYDSRDELAVITRRVISHIPFFNHYTDREKDILGKYSSSLFTLNTIYNANKRIVSHSVETSIDKIENFLLLYWKTVSIYMEPWNELEKRIITKVDLREQYIVTQSVIIQAFGRLGHYFFVHPELDCDTYISKLAVIDWRRDSDNWKHRVIKQNGRMINNETAIILACNRIKELAGIPLDADEAKRESELLRG